MKCPQCGLDKKHKFGMNCVCGYYFCLDPKIDKITDGKFLAAIHSASNGDTYYFTQNQLYTAVCRKKSFGLNVPLIGTFLHLLSDTPTEAHVDSYITKWEKNERKIEKLIRSPKLHDPPPEWKEPDIYDYGVERLLIVQHDLLVDLFVINGFHSLQRVLILSESGYPEYLVPIAFKVLEENDQLPVYLLHDSTPQGMEMLSRLPRTPFPIDGHPVTDLGITPDDVRRLRRLRAAKPKRHDYAVPVDCLPYAILAAGVSQSFEQNVPLGVFLTRPQEGQGDGGSSFG